MKYVMLSLVLVFLMASANTQAESVSKSALTISKIELRPKPKGIQKLLGISMPAEVYMRIYNEGEETDTLLKVTSSATKKNTFQKRFYTDVGHKTWEEEPLPHITAQPGVTALEYMGEHILLGGIKEEPPLGSKFPLTLTFEKAGDIEVEAIVIRPTDYVVSTR